jgi:putative FmdB family regulatory protein
MYCVDCCTQRLEVILMPTYQFRCKIDQSMLEIQQGFYDNTIPNCPLCGKEMNKVIGATPVHFRGSGFYRTDNK